MSYVITAIVSMAIGAWLALLMRNSGNISAEERAYKVGRQDGYEAGYKSGDQDGYRAGIKWMSTLRKDRVDVAPGPDSIRPEGKAHD